MLHTVKTYWLHDFYEMSRAFKGQLLKFGLIAQRIPKFVNKFEGVQFPQ